MEKCFLIVAVLLFLFSCTEIERDNPNDERAYNFIGKSSAEGSSSGVEAGDYPSSSSGNEELNSSSSNEEPSSSSAGVSSSVETDNYPSSSSEESPASSSSAEPSSSSAEPSSSSEAESSSSVVPSSSSVVSSSSSAEPSSSSVVLSSSSIEPSSSSAEPSSSSVAPSSSSDENLCTDFDQKAEVNHHDKMKKQFCDERDGKKYVYVVIGTQTWMAENLNYAEEGKCYGDNSGDDSQNMCDTYGRLYNWETAKTVCPSGWHLPTQAEWNVLGNDATKLKTSGWGSNGTDDYEFSALLGGYGLPDGSFGYVGGGSYWWSAREGISNSAYSRGMAAANEDAYWSRLSKSYLFSVRCLQN